MHNYLNIDSSTINNLITLNGKGYTKHYFEGDRRVCSKIGGGFTGRTEDDINDRIKPITGDEYDKLFEQQYQGMKETFGRCMETDVEFNLKYDPYKTIMENELGRDEAEPAFYYHGDHLGSSAYLTDEAGAITQTLNYLPYGEDWVDVHNNPNYLSRYKYNGKEKDPESGLHYYGARYYDSDISQWLSIDPMADKYPSLSPYNYCADNPVILVDPDGREIDWVEDKNEKIYWDNKAINQATTKPGEKYRGKQGYELTDNGLLNCYNPDKSITKGGVMLPEAKVVSTYANEHAKTMANPIVQSIHKGQNEFLKGSLSLCNTLLDRAASGLEVTGYFVMLFGGVPVGEALVKLGNGLDNISTLIDAGLKLSEGNVMGVGIDGTTLIINKAGRSGIKKLVPSGSTDETILKTGLDIKTKMIEKTGKGQVRPQARGKLSLSLFY